MSKRISQWLFFLLALGILGGVIWFNQQKMQAQARFGSPPKAAGQPPAAPAMPMPSANKSDALLAEVSVMTVQTGSYPAYISAYGAVEPHYQLNLTAQVSGQIEKISPKLASGQRVSTKEVLIQLEDSSYRSALAEAQATLADAKLTYEQEQQQSKQAQQEWKASGLSGQPSSLVLRKPQLAAAKANLTRAEAAVKTANLNLQRTQIHAPFDAVVISREVALGTYVQTGSTIATLHSTDWVEVPIYLSEHEWAALPSVAELQAESWPVTLHSALGDTQWTGRLLRQAQHLESSTRLRGVILGVDKPLDQEPPLLSGAFVKAVLQGRDVAGLWQLPSTALSQQGDIWYVQNGALSKFAATPAFSDPQHIYIQPPAELADSAQQVLTHPLNAYVVGMSVKAVEVAAHEIN